MSDFAIAETIEQVNDLTTSTEDQNTSNVPIELVTTTQVSNEEESIINPTESSDADSLTQVNEPIEDNNNTAATTTTTTTTSSSYVQVESTSLAPSLEEMEDVNEETYELVKDVIDGKLKRLDRHIQLVLEEARKRHHELEELRDEEVRLGGELWVEMYDPTHDSFYYYGTFTGELSWTKPESYVMKTDSDDLMRVIVKIQCLFRQKLARNLAWRMKMSKIQQEKQQQQQEEEEEEKEEKDKKKTSSSSSSSSHTWVEVYDPFTKLLYYYCASTNETRWEAPSMYISAFEDREMAAAITIQSYSRSFAAKQLVEKRKQQVLKLQNEKKQQEQVRLRERRRRQYMEKSEDERESLSRRQMLEQERVQCSFGDFFWGLEKKQKEIQRQLQEEKMLHDAEEFWRRVNLTLKLRGEMDFVRTQEEEAKKKKKELCEEQKERLDMREEEKKQCFLGDHFWGIEAEEKKEFLTRQEMLIEDFNSKEFGQWFLQQETQLKWTFEAKLKQDQKNQHFKKMEYKNQVKYLEAFYQFQTSEQVVTFLWPTEIQPISTTPSTPSTSSTPSTPSTPCTTSIKNTNSKTKNTTSKQQHHHHNLQVKKKQNKKQHQQQQKEAYLIEAIPLEKKTTTTTTTVSAAAASEEEGQQQQQQQQQHEEHEEQSKSKPIWIPYQRSTTTSTHTPPPSVWIVHCGNAAHINGRKGKLQVHFADTNRIVAQAKAMATTSTKKSPPKKHSQQDATVAYHSQHLPDPNLPARFNNVPFKPSQLSPTRDILNAKHEKQTLLKPLHKPSSIGTTSSIMPTVTREEEVQSKGPSHNNQESNFNSITGDLLLIPTISQASMVSSSSATTGASLTSQSTTGITSTARIATNSSVFASQKRSRHRGTRSGALRKRLEMERQVWKRLFLHMDLDGNGKIDQNELLWAFKRDEEIHSVAAESELLKVAMKDPNLFVEQLGASTVASNTTNILSLWEITWERFLSFCEQKYDEIISQIAHEEQVQEEIEAKKALQRTEEEEEALMLETEESIARQVFELVDIDMNGILDPEEMRRALEKNPEIKELVCRSKSLKPLVEEATFMTAFLQMETQNPNGMSLEEFVLFCTEVASIAKLNGLA